MPTPDRPGTYWFTDIFEQRQRVDVIDDAGVLCARFVDDGDVDLIPVDDMAGTWATA